MAKKEQSKYIVTINNQTGTCDTPIFAKMAAKGDINSVSITEHVNDIITVTGMCDTNVETSEKTFEQLIINTEEYGLLHTSGQVFKDSIVDYISDCNKFRIIARKCKKGTCYKASPVLEDSTLIDDNTEVPFN